MRKGVTCLCVLAVFGLTLFTTSAPADSPRTNIYVITSDPPRASILRGGISKAPRPYAKTPYYHKTSRDKGWHNTLFIAQQEGGRPVSTIFDDKSGSANTKGPVLRHIHFDLKAGQVRQSKLSGKGAATWAMSSKPITSRRVIHAIHRRLIKLGYTGIDKPSGRAGPETVKAIKRFQRSQGIREDGMPSLLLLAALKSTSGGQARPSPPELRPRVSPKTVYLTQTYLMKLGYAGVVRADGVPGPETINAIKQYQLKKGLAVDGVASKDLLTRLKLDAAHAGKRPPRKLKLPTPIYGHSGKYLSPIKQSGVLAGWADPSRKPRRRIAPLGREFRDSAAQMADQFNNSKIGLGRLLGEGIGGDLGEIFRKELEESIRVGEIQNAFHLDLAHQRKLQSRYDFQYKKELQALEDESDLSFNTMKDLAIYLKLKFGGYQFFPDALQAVFDKYPGFKAVYAQYAANLPTPGQGSNYNTRYGSGSGSGSRGGSGGTGGGGNIGSTGGGSGSAGGGGSGDVHYERGGGYFGSTTNPTTGQPCNQTQPFGGLPYYSQARWKEVGTGGSRTRNKCGLLPYKLERKRTFENCKWVYYYRLTNLNRQQVQVYFKPVSNQKVHFKVLTPGMRCPSGINYRLNTGGNVHYLDRLPTRFNLNPYRTNGDRIEIRIEMHGPENAYHPTAFHAMGVPITIPTNGSCGKMDKGGCGARITQRRPRNPLIGTWVNLKSRKRWVFRRNNTAIMGQQLRGNFYCDLSYRVNTRSRKITYTINRCTGNGRPVNQKNWGRTYTIPYTLRGNRLKIVNTTYQKTK